MWFRAAVLLIFLAPVLTTHGQQSNRQSKNRYVIVPPESILLLVASQADCPLKFEDARLLLSADTNSAWGASYKLHNRGIKPIRSFTAVLWSSYGTGGTLGYPGRIAHDLIMPGQTVNGSDEDLVPLTEELRDKLKLRGPMKAVVVLMIENIKFADGSSYNDEVTSEAVLAYFAHVETKVNRANREK